MNFWLLKTEPGDWSWNQQVESGNNGVEWNGVRNFQASKERIELLKNESAFEKLNTPKKTTLPLPGAK